MGCLFSSEPTLSPQQMLEKQRQIMLDRQKEFEKKREQQGQKILTQQIPNRDQQRGSRDISRSLESFSKVPISSSRESSEGLNNSLNVSKIPIITKPVEKIPPPPPTPIIQEPKILEENENVETPKVDAAKYTLDPNDINARRSKNVHDLAMYGKDVQRRASFNPRPKESPFSPELQAQMKLGHEKMMEEESKKKVERLLSSNGDEINSDNLDDVKSLKEIENNEFSMSSITETRETMVNSSPIPLPPSSGDVDSKFVPRNSEDRKSKNIHDMSQYMGAAKTFQRRASLLPKE
jgi:hypothetical protein